MSIFNSLFDELRRERNRSILKGDVEGARTFDHLDAELRAALLALVCELDLYDDAGSN
jgi:hypothetical protein